MAEQNKWMVWDDGLDATDAKRVMAWRERYYPDYEFKVSGSEFHGAGYFQVEARKKDCPP